MSLVERVMDKRLGQVKGKVIQKNEKKYAKMQENDQEGSKALSTDHHHYIFVKNADHDTVRIHNIHTLHYIFSRKNNVTLLMGLFN